MQIVVVGAGQVGSSIAASLCETHDVVVVDIDPSRVDDITYSVDALALEGDGTSLTTLQEAGIDDADLLIASTDDDETNIITCATAKTTDDPFTIARVRSTNFLETWQATEGALGVDFMVGTTMLAARTVVRVIGLPAARDVDTFVGGRVQMAEFSIPEDSPIAGQTVQEADRFDSLTFAAILRDDEVIIPRGPTTFTADDEVVVIGSRESVRALAAEVSPHAQEASDVLIVGGTDIGYQVARLLGEQGLSPRLIEQDPERARELAEDLPNATVLKSDGTDREFLEREHIADVDTVVSALHSNERNLLTSLLAKRLGADRTIAIVEEMEFVDLFEEVGVDVAVNPRGATAEEITRFTRERRAKNVAIIESDRAEVIEIEVGEESILAGRPIEESIHDLPDGFVIGAIMRAGEFITPRGNTVVDVGDSVVVFVDAVLVDEVTAQL